VYKRQLQGRLATAAVGETPLAGVSSRRAADAAWCVAQRIDDINRAGIDAKTRLHTIMVAARAA